MKSKEPQTAEEMLCFGQHFAVIWRTLILWLVRLPATRMIKAGNDFVRSLAQPPAESRVSYDQALMIKASSSWVLKFLNDGGGGVEISFKATYRLSLLDTSYQALQNSGQNLTVFQGKELYQTDKGSLVCVFGSILT